jgi:hypothetical protein
MTDGVVRGVPASVAVVLVAFLVFLAVATTMALGGAL